jgi:hypothetical protein
LFTLPLSYLYMSPKLWLCHIFISSCHKTKWLCHEMLWLWPLSMTMSLFFGDEVIFLNANIITFLRLFIKVGVTLPQSFMTLPQKKCHCHFWLSLCT